LPELAKEIGKAMSCHFPKRGWPRPTRAVLFVIAALSSAGSVRAERYCSNPPDAPSNCSYTTAEQCRAANEGEGRCVPDAWLEKKPTAKKPAEKTSTKRVDLDRNSIRDIYLGPLGRYGPQEIPQQYNYDTGPNRHNAASWIGNGNGW
jgi:hypothetical protein